jgi:hypothetical protein
LRLIECKVLENGTSGLLCRDADSVDLIVCEFANNAGDGANVRNTKGSIMSCSIGRNLGAGIRAERSSLLIDGGEVYENAKAGVSLEGDAGTVIQGCGIYYNAFRGIDLSESSPWVLSSLISSNSDEHGGGMHCRDGSAPSICNTEFQGNMAYDGGAVWASASTPALTNCLLYANAAQEGPAIKAVGGSTVRLVNCTIFRNVTRPSKGTDGAGGGGAGPGCEDSEVTLLNCIAWANDPEETCWTLKGCLVGQDPLFEDPGVFNFELTRTLDLGGHSYVIPAFVGEPPILRPLHGSPAEDVGILEGTVSYDFDLRLRPAGKAPDAGAYEIGSGPAVGFLRGDVNSDSELDIADPIRCLAYLFLGGAAPSCLKTADADDDGAVNIGDAILLLGYLFLGGPAPAWPFGGCGLDATADLLSCDAHAPCV